MFLNVIFLAGGICIGYLLRGELDRRKSKKAWAAAIEEGIKAAQKIMETIENKTEDEEYETDEPGEISFEGLADLFKNSSNSTDETIKL